MAESGSVAGGKDDSSDGFGAEKFVQLFSAVDPAAHHPSPSIPKREKDINA
jgi:hypothetical protein